ncbi:MAG: T9SS type A sorting domain-containing protein [Bacteroidales bacterium]
MARTGVVVFFLVLFNISAHATIHTVKQDGTGDFTTIQAGINAATTADTVLVWPGTYFENIDYNSKSITVASLYMMTQEVNYIYSTIIDGNDIWSCVNVSYCSYPGSTFSGFTLQHGAGGYSNTLKAGGGIMIIESTLRIDHCIIKNCRAKSGGGIACIYSEVHLSGSIIANNVAFGKTGGILIAQDSEFFFDTINKNSVYLNYGAMGGCDISRTAPTATQYIFLDTATVLHPDFFFFAATDGYGYPIENNLIWEIEHAKIEQIAANLYVNPTGDNSNTGLSLSEPLKNLSYAIRKILPDTINPKSIFLADGLYSPSTNGEVFPAPLRSYVSIIGNHAESTVLDAEYIYPLLNSYLFTRSVSIENITFRRGIDSQAVLVGNGGFNIVGNNNLVFSDIVLEQVESEFYSGFYSNFSDITLQNTKIIDNTGGYSVVISNTKEELHHVIIKNSIIKNTGPLPAIDEGFGGSVGFSGTLSYPNATKGTLINVLISENTFTAEPGTIGFGICGLSCSQHAKVDVINSTIGNNVVTNPVNSAQVYATEGAEINFYNSIIYGTEDYEIFLGNGQPTSYISTINVSHSNVKGGEENVQNWNNIHNLNWLTGNIEEDPLWLETEPDFYNLQAGSPCINSGVPMYEAGMGFPYIKDENGKYILYMLDGDTVTLPAYDLAGNPRISGGRIDMGAYEWQDTATVSTKFEVRSSELKVYPNPFKSNTFIRFTTAKECFVQLEVINIQGQQLRSITGNPFPPGDYHLVWNGKDDGGFDMKPGNYFICLYLDGTLVSCEKVMKTR